MAGPCPRLSSEPRSPPWRLSSSRGRRACRRQEPCHLTEAAPHLVWVDRYFSHKYTAISNTGTPVRNFSVLRVRVVPTYQFQNRSCDRNFPNRHPRNRPQPARRSAKLADLRPLSRRPRPLRLSRRPQPRLSHRLGCLFQSSRLNGEGEGEGQSTSTPPDFDPPRRPFSCVI